MSRIFLSHSSTNNAEAVALRDWLAANGWKDEIFLDLDPQRGIAAGERWERALHQAASRCEAVLFLVSTAWLASDWCRKELNLAHALNKRLFGVLIEDLPSVSFPRTSTGTWQIVRLATAGITSCCARLCRLRTTRRMSLFGRGVGAPQAWAGGSGPRSQIFCLAAAERPGPSAVSRAASAGSRGRRHLLRPRCPDRRGARPAARVARYHAATASRHSRRFRCRQIVVPARRAFSAPCARRPQFSAAAGDPAGAGGDLRRDRSAFCARSRLCGGKIPIARADLRAIIQIGAIKLKPLLQALADKAMPSASGAGTAAKPPTLILSIDQAEELFLAEAADEARSLLALLRDLLNDDAPALIAVFTIRSDKYEKLQLAPELEDVRQDMLSLPPMPKGSYAEVIKGPARRLDGTARVLTIEDALVDALLADIEAGGAKDALPLLAFTLERLYGEYHSGGSLKLSHYEALGRVKGSIEAAVERALQAADADPAIPRDRAARLALLRRGLIPWLAGIDPDTGAPRRRVARLSEIPAEARPLIQHLVEQRLLATDVNKDTGEAIIEPAHEALLRQWGLLDGWLTEDAALLAVLEGVKRASRDWAANNRSRAWLAHQADRLSAAERLSFRPDLAASLEPTDRDYIAACRKAEADASRRRRLLQIATYASLVVVIIGLVAFIEQATIADQWRYWTVTWPYMRAQVRPYVLSRAKEQALKPAEFVQGMRAGLPGDRRRAGGIVHDGIAADRERPLYQRRTAAPGYDRQAVCRVEIRTDLCRLGRLRRRRRLQRLQAHRSGLGTRPAAGDQRQLGRRAGLRGMALASHWQDLSVAHRGRIRVCDARRDDDGLSVGRRHQAQRTSDGRLRRLRQQVGRLANGAGRFVRAQQVRSVRCGGQCPRMDRGLHPQELQRRADKWLGVAGGERRRLHQSYPARRFLGQRCGRPPLCEPQQEPHRLPERQHWLPRRPDASWTLSLCYFVSLGFGGEAPNVYSREAMNDHVKRTGVRSKPTINSCCGSCPLSIGFPRAKSSCSVTAS